jgi:predicted nucleic acid-binding protein
VFVDTNILVFANVPVAPRHAQALGMLERYRTFREPLWISRQVLREYLAAMSRAGPLRTPHPSAILGSTVRQFERIFRIAEDGPSVTARLLELLERFPCGGRQVHDANIVATMLVHGIDRLLTDNVQDFKRFDSLIGIVPLRPA